MRSSVMNTAVILTAIAGLAHAQNLVTNPGFEDGDTFLGVPDDWAQAGSGAWATTPVRTGTYSALVNSATGFNSWNRVNSEYVPLDADGSGPVNFSGWYYIEPGTEGTVLGVKLEWRYVLSNGNSLGYGSTGDLLVDRVEGAWTEFSFDLLPPDAAGATEVQLFTFTPGGSPASGFIAFDDISITQAPTCGVADFDRNAQLDVFDILDFFFEFGNVSGGVGPDVNRITNPSFEESEMREIDPDTGEMAEFPVGWDKIRNSGGAYETGGVDGAPAARTGSRLVSVSGAGVDPGNDRISGFNSWSVQTPTRVPVNSENELVFEFWYNVPEQTPAFSTGLFGAKLEYFRDNGDGTFSGAGGTGDIIVATDAVTAGWQQFRFTIPAGDVPPAADVTDLQLFIFDPDQLPDDPNPSALGKAYFDDVSITIADAPSRADLDGDNNPETTEDGDGDADIFDILSFFNIFGAGC